MEALDDLRALDVAASAQSEKGFNDLHRQLRHAAGFDRDGDRPYDAHGRLIITSAEQFARWASEAGLAGVMVA